MEFLENFHDAIDRKCLPTNRCCLRTCSHTTRRPNGPISRLSLSVCDFLIQIPLLKRRASLPPVPQKGHVGTGSRIFSDRFNPFPLITKAKRTWIPKHKLSDLIAIDSISNNSEL